MAQLIPQAWGVFIESLRISVASVQFTASHRACLKSQMDMSTVYEQMEKLEQWILQAVTQAEITTPASSSEELDPAVYEVATGQVLRRLARIRLSRYAPSPSSH